MRDSSFKIFESLKRINFSCLEMFIQGNSCLSHREEAKAKNENKKTENKNTEKPSWGKAIRKDRSTHLRRVHFPGSYVGVTSHSADRELLTALASLTIYGCSLCPWPETSTWVWSLAFSYTPALGSGWSRGTERHLPVHRTNPRDSHSRSQSQSSSAITTTFSSDIW